ncbi:MAG: hypothetical protein KA758_12560 [Acidimicrobiales bacterium]|nr:hypothetical protein [Acidimicrobiales bacterium]
MSTATSNEARSLVAGRLLPDRRDADVHPVLAVARRPADLDLHWWRVRSARDVDAVYAALVDLFIATSNDQVSVRRQALDEAGVRLRAEQDHFLRACVPEGLSATSVIPGAAASLLAAGVSEGRPLVVSRSVPLAAPVTPAAADVPVAGAVAARAVESAPEPARSEPLGPTLGAPAAPSRTEPRVPAPAAETDPVRPPDPEPERSPEPSPVGGGRPRRMRLAVAAAAAVAVGLAVGVAVLGSDGSDVDSRSGVTAPELAGASTTNASSTAIAPPQATTPPSVSTSTDASATSATPSVDVDVEGAVATATTAADAALRVFTDPAAGAVSGVFAPDSPSATQLEAIRRALLASGVRVDGGPLDATVTGTEVAADSATVTLEARHDGLVLRSADGATPWVGPGTVTLRVELRATESGWQVVVLHPFTGPDQG